MKYLFALILTLLMTSIAQAGVKVIGSGGKGLECQTSTGTMLRLLDLEEGERIHNLLPETAGLSQDPVERAHQVLDRLKLRFPEFVAYVSAHLEYVVASRQWESLTDDTADQDHYEIPGNCKLVQLAEFSGEDIQTRRFVFDPNRVPRLSVDDHAALLLHEAMYSIAYQQSRIGWNWEMVKVLPISNIEPVTRETYGKPQTVPVGSRNVRRMVAELFAEPWWTKRQGLAGFARWGIHVFSSPKGTQFYIETGSHQMINNPEAWVHYGKMILNLEDSRFILHRLGDLALKEIGQYQTDLLLFSFSSYGRASFGVPERWSKEFRRIRSRHQEKYLMPTDVLLGLTPLILKPGELSQ